MAEFVSLIHAVDSMKLLKEINKQALRYRRTINCLLQVKIAKEDSKFGLDSSLVASLLESEEFKELQNVQIEGLMGMATFTDNQQQLSEEFSSLKELYDQLKEHHNFTTLSMGMSADYLLAIEHGSNMIRVGSALFGARNYN